MWREGRGGRMTRQGASRITSQSGVCGGTGGGGGGGGEATLSGLSLVPAEHTIAVASRQILGLVLLGEAGLTPCRPSLRRPSKMGNRVVLAPAALPAEQPSMA